MKATFNVFAGLFAVVSLCVLAYLGYHKWLQTRIYEEKITVTAYYMKYACGDCSIDMKVQHVDHPAFGFMVGQDIFPTPKTKSIDELCEFISTADSKSSTSPDDIPESFTLVGYLHKNPHGFSIEDCPSAPFFTVEKIKHGVSGDWFDF